MATTTHGNQTTETTRDERRQTYERVLGIIEHNTVYNQPAFIAEHRIRRHAAQTGVDTDRTDSVLQAGVRNGDLLRINRERPDCEDVTLYAYARDTDHLRAAADAVTEWDDVSESFVAEVTTWCEERIAEMGGDR